MFGRLLASWKVVQDAQAAELAASVRKVGKPPIEKVRPNVLLTVHCGGLNPGAVAC